jgi:hypothetical protein
MAWGWKFLLMISRRLCSKSNRKSQVHSMEVGVVDLQERASQIPAEEEEIITFGAGTEINKFEDTLIPPGHRRKYLKMLRTKPKYATPRKSSLKMAGVPMLIAAPPE